MSRELRPAICTGSFRKLSKPDKQRHTRKHVSRSILLLGEPLDVTLDRLADPGCADSIDGSWTNEISVEHNNLLSKVQVQETSVCSPTRYVPDRAVQILKYLWI